MSNEKFKNTVLFCASINVSALVFACLSKYHLLVSLRLYLVKFATSENKAIYASFYGKLL